jgi:hypothetical protein
MIVVGRAKAEATVEREVAEYCRSSSGLVAVKP